MFFQIGLFRLIQPEAVRAQDGDIGINVSLSYSISSGERSNATKELTMCFWILNINVVFV